jgi:hypothetical protein
MPDTNRYKRALEEIGNINDISLIECDEGLTRLLYELNDRFLLIQSIVNSTLADAKQEESEMDQTADQVQDPVESQFDPFPDEIKACPECGKPMVERNGKRGKFFGCSGFPACRYTRNEPTTVHCKAAIHKSDLDPYSMKSEAELFERCLTDVDPTDRTDMDEIFSSCGDGTGGGFDAI